jgi:hypothetical protein
LLSLIDDRFLPPGDGQGPQRHAARVAVNACSPSAAGAGSMKFLPLLFAGLALGLPVSASATVCDEINGTYSGARIGELGGNSALLAFDLMTLTAGAGSGRQVQVASETAPAGDQIDLEITCVPVDATHALLVVKARRSGSGTAFSDAGSATVTLYDGGSRLWVEGNTPPGSMAGWLLRVPPDP